MKRAILLFILFFIAGISLTYSQKVNVTDYQVPISRATVFRFDGTWSWSQNGRTVTSNDARGKVLYKTFYSSLPLAWFLNVDAVGGKNLSVYNHNVKLDVSFLKYFLESEDFFGSAQLVAQHIGSSKILPQSNDNYRQIKSDITIGFGYGRYINATALAKAVRIEGHLLRDDVIKGNLPKETMIAIANIIDRQQEYQEVYQTTYETFWFDDIEKEIQKSGLIDEFGGVGSIGFQRMRQVLFNINEKVNDRYYGWLTSVGISIPTSTSDRSPVGSPEASLSGRYSFPISWDTQINFKIDVLSPLDSLFFKKYTVRSNLDFIYELSNRVNFVSGYRFDFVKQPGIVAEPIHNLDAAFLYYIENNIYLTINSNLSKQGSSPTVLGTSLGINYNIF
ncbi:MAG: hypothetical protein COZ80_01275 [Ignavibacteria bacterium CG_4_8_14_3_um_filter_37_9]|nr:hypothetical protein [Ignavibacteria bacterium]OIO16018.1 MAG: hypothetical protein AUJ54_11865 [Ignavibacteria bacterium CG1_02_37_35]PIX00219.1 MAG: hypothetical protein COZ80_01275 [Ignavibacteria bacterium CG_4_8_14_3_um_filter_37_9]PIX93401.1 MAG: hypothetical protein COZ25_10845 [Ignavibacteria bacterium CG_4_10_14_3_um_filter_37_18]PJC59255.1 MAG: hypothetical protein CO025_06750 [Ignavibacteria bacterium CG_4_9_14_0_2_um_filter_37_13]